MGRIEQVQDARHAIYLFDELAKQKRISANKSPEDVLAFAKFISELKNKRFFDSRIREIYEIEAIDSFLNTNNAVLKSDSRYFTTLADFWNNGNGPIRNSGTRFSAGIYPGYNYNNYYNTGYNYTGTSINYSTKALLMNVGLQLIHEKPINLFWQNTIEVNGFVGTIVGTLHDNISSEQNKIRIPNIQLGYMQKIGFYPNTRTSVEYSYGINFIQLLGKSDAGNSIIGVEGVGVKALTNLVMNFYISPKVRLSLRSALYYIWQDSKDHAIINFDNATGSTSELNPIINSRATYNNIFKEKDFMNSFQFTLSYSIF